jgi:hypothetical protein
MADLRQLQPLHDETAMATSMSRELLLESSDRYRAVCLRLQEALAARLDLAPASGRASLAADLALYGRGPDGLSPIQRYLLEAGHGLSDEENEVLDAMGAAVFSLFRVKGPGEDETGVRALDLLSGETLWIVDRELELIGAPGVELAFRAFCMQGFWMTTGAAVPIDDAVWRELESMGVSRVQRGVPVSWLDRDALAQVVYHYAGLQ